MLKTPMSQGFCRFAGSLRLRGRAGACVLVWAVLHHLYFYYIQRVGMRLRVAVCHMIYRKVSVTQYCNVFTPEGSRTFRESSL